VGPGASAITIQGGALARARSASSLGGADHARKDKRGGGQLRGSERLVMS